MTAQCMKVFHSEAEHGRWDQDAAVRKASAEWLKRAKRLNVILLPKLVQVCWLCRLAS